MPAPAGWPCAGARFDAVDPLFVVELRADYATAPLNAA
jgi:hypothetical protein